MQQTIPTELLKPGISLPGTICDRTGAVLIERGVELTEAHVLLLESLTPEDLVGDADWPADMLRPMPQFVDARIATTTEPEPTENKSKPIKPPELIEVESLRPGMRLAQDLFEQSGLLLLAAGMRITARFLQLLQKRRIKVLRIGTPDDTAPPSEEHETEPSPAPLSTAEADRVAETNRIVADELRMAPTIHPVRAWRRPRLPISELRQEAAKGLERHAKVSSSIADASETLLVGGRVSAKSLGGTVKSFVDMVTIDFDILPLIVSMQRTEDEYLFDHCANVSMIALSIGAQLGLNHDQLMEVALGGLLQDIGMLRVPGNIRLAPRTLTAEERIEIERHPLHTLEMLERVPGLPPSSRVIGYQAHERCDGSGYPRGSSCGKIHPLASIVSVADAFAAMTRPRPHRQALMPYEAAKKILIEGNANRFDLDIVRAFLNTVSLFPIGSAVELHNGVQARVLRANVDQHTRPIVEILDDEGTTTGEVIDLSEDASLTVVRAHPYAQLHENAAPTQAQ